MSRIFLLFILAALCSCQPQIVEKVTKVYPSGQAESVMYYVEGEIHPHAQKVYYADGKLKIEGAFVNGLRQGEWTSYYEDGQVWTLNTYDQDVNHGHYQMFNKDGSTKLKGQYDRGEETGIWTINDEKGNFIEERSFN